MTRSADLAKPWFHGSPLLLAELRPGSTITQESALAEAFSHKPSIVSDAWHEPGGVLRHDGRQPGWLYAVDEPVREGDVAPVSDSAIGPGAEWLTTRPLRLRKIQRTSVVPAELLTYDDLADLRRRSDALRSSRPRDGRAARRVAPRRRP
jgi:hypothetical protein